MLCKIADLYVDIPEAGGMSPRCREYLTTEEKSADITIRRESYNFSCLPGFSENDATYLDSGRLFYLNLLRFDGLMLHASAVEYENSAYLFSGPCGMGKSTHSRLWQKAFGQNVKIFNDDKPALRRLNDGWFAYGTPWCDKDGINVNIKSPLRGICFLKRGEENSIRRLSPIEAVAAVISQTVHRFSREVILGKMTEVVDKLVREIPIYELKSKADVSAAKLSYETMKNGVLK